jgi:hypothetical protein
LLDRGAGKSAALIKRIARSFAITSRTLSSAQRRSSCAWIAFNMRATSATLLSSAIVRAVQIVQFRSWVGAEEMGGELLGVVGIIAE